MATTLQELDALVEKVRAAQAVYADYTQEQVDAIFHHAAARATAQRIRLAKLAVEETGMGVLEDKVIKNHFSSEYIYNQYKDVKTCGIIEDDVVNGYRQIAAPLGIVAGVIPTTNPTSTAIFKALLCLKTRNGIIFSPHPRANNCTREAAMCILRAAVEAGAPEGIIACLDKPGLDVTQRLMSHPHVNLILATGGPGMVRAAYSSGTPAIGVGAGNTPVVIDSSADIKMAVNSILMSKTFDNGLICASEQTIVVEESIADAVREEFCNRGGWFADGADGEALGK
ncbi:MAG: aldehyde dehydrogenase family protein, partial [Desulfovibrio sp.]|nr:aldehyde dehydrogenase family protein [Desulfovibrio sp.]